jgi:hypothetical protein
MKRERAEARRIYFAARRLLTTAQRNSGASSSLRGRTRLDCARSAMMRKAASETVRTVGRMLGHAMQLGACRAPQSEEGIDA